ncbi:hypothetical protein, partial [Thiolapillus sp.]|uniref:hypothetical protein n=1 Tax=Thiolapillus sp. TaxID=2017437 RepID=UPI003AF82710
MENQWRPLCVCQYMHDMARDPVLTIVEKSQTLLTPPARGPHRPVTDKLIAQTVVWVQKNFGKSDAGQHLLVWKKVK